MKSDGKLYKKPTNKPSYEVPKFEQEIIKNNKLTHGKNVDDVNLCIKNSIASLEKNTHETTNSSFNLTSWEKFKQSGGRKELTLNEYAKAEKIAERAYNKIRSSNSDVKRIASNTGLKEFNIRRIKEHLFIKKHE